MPLLNISMENIFLLYPVNKVYNDEWHVFNLFEISIERLF